jgi:hypothetical protein
MVGGGSATSGNAAAAVARLAVMERLVRAGRSIADSLDPFDASNTIVQVPRGGETCHLHPGDGSWKPLSVLVFIYLNTLYIKRKFLCRKRAAFWARTGRRFSF